MSILGRIFGSAATEPITAVGNVLTGLFGDKGEKLTHEQIMARLAAQPQLAQTEINKVEAGHRTIFVAGWRPFIGWVCGTGLAYAFLVAPTLEWLVAIRAIALPEGASAVGPKVPADIMLSLVLALLGIAGYRTVEKLNGKAK